MQWKITILINFMYGIIIINYILDQQEKIISRKFRKQKKNNLFKFLVFSKIESNFKIPKKNKK